MSALAHASLSDAERQMLDELVVELRNEFGSQLRSVWLYGSRARGETPHEESDVDLLVVLDRRSMAADHRVFDVISRTAKEVGISSLTFSTLVYDVERISQRRAIDSFFMREVDRDKIVLYGEP